MGGFMRDERSLFIKMVSNFVHFIVVQASALCIALLSTFVPKYVPLKIVVSIMLFYAIFTAVATGMQLFLVARIYNANEKKPGGVPASDDH
jgi:hypothetical protein